MKKILLLSTLLLLISSASFSQELPPEQQQELGYFQEYIGGEVYRYGAPGYPESKLHPFTYTFLSKEDSDLQFVLEDPILRQYFGDPLVEFIKEGRVDTIGFILGRNEVVICVQIGNAFYDGFLRVPQNVIQLLQQYDRP